MTVDDIEARYGRPREAAYLVDYPAEEFAFLRRSMRDGRNQDVTLLIRRAGLVAQIRKPLYPPECFRAPGGSPAPGEDLATCAIREAREETGLEVRLERYLFRAHVTFRCEPEIVQWVTHVFVASAASDALSPQDRREVIEARWFTDEAYRQMNVTLAGAALCGLQYRAALQQAAWAALHGR